MDDNAYRRAIGWIYGNLADDGNGIVVTNKQRKLYPEVSGYFIPSLINIGEINLAKSFAKWLCSIQGDNGAWYDADGMVPQIFDTGQVLKGLIAIRDVLPEVDSNITKGVDWILSRINEKGRLVQPEEKGRWDDSYCNDLIFIYALSPIIEAGKIYKKSEYIESVNVIIDYYCKTRYNQIVNYSLFSHFYAYIIEGLVDCGRKAIAQKAMDNLVKYQREDGSIPAFKDVNWVCSTAMFQYAVIWYKLGEKIKGDLAYNYALSLQNDTGGWYGSYAPTKITYYLNRILSKLRLSRTMYLKDEEISWAVKFFLDAKILKGESDRYE